MPKVTKPIEWWETKSFAYGETIMSIIIGGTFSYLIPTIGIPVLVALFCISCLLIWKAYSKSSILVPSILIVLGVIGISTGQSYLNKPKQSNFATPDALISPILQDMDIRISDLAREDFKMRNKTIINCNLYGPAVIYPKKGMRGRIGFADGDINSNFIEATNKIANGVIELDNCVIQDCVFHKISVIGPLEEVKKWKEKVVIIKKD